MLELTKSRLPAAARARRRGGGLAAAALVRAGHQLPVDDRVRVPLPSEARAADGRVESSPSSEPSSSAGAPEKLSRELEMPRAAEEAEAVVSTERSSSSKGGALAEKLVALLSMPSAAEVVESEEATERSSSSSSGAATGGGARLTGSGGSIKAGGREAGAGGAGGGGPRPTSSGKNTARCSGSSIGSGSMANR